MFRWTGASHDGGNYPSRWGGGGSLPIPPILASPVFKNRYGNCGNLATLVSDQGTQIPIWISSLSTLYTPYTLYENPSKLSKPTKYWIIIFPSIKPGGFCCRLAIIPGFLVSWQCFHNFKSKASGLMCFFGKDLRSLSRICCTITLSILIDASGNIICSLGYQ